MRKDEIARLQKIRLNMAVIMNMLEVMQTVGSLSKPEHIAKGKSKYQTPFITALFALAMRCSRLLEEVCFKADLLASESAGLGIDFAARSRFLAARQKEVLDAAQLIRAERIGNALLKLAKARAGLGEFCAELDCCMQKKMLL